MNLKTNDIIECWDGNEYQVEYYERNLFRGYGVVNKNQRLFRRNGQYLGADRSKNVKYIHKE